ncbi:efflux RND transporter periplasmic adaptor subunit [Lichenifustis flavocetrariae]|uniref:Efflux RND transporter periplasmic adaptor subunit n=1 Tax=Lichenifustis flavocetrariae TaxID=2949735 RepID=A0AA42CL40_9HYPH|nr:efflux RND transporter periplasmic adaptor subunit [Lichenifustis flavocetrariae]MCW6511193.1 efflux RND transporter periplasmic adaptor subunit [Lichenifustis flavocetrariae]
MRNHHLITAAILAALGLAGCEKPEGDARTEPPLVMTTLVKPAGDVERAFTGTVSARVQSNLGFRVPGKVVERLVDTGQTVLAGQPLMRIDRTDLQLAITAQDNAVAAAKAVLVQATNDEARDRDLLAKGWTPRQKWDASKAALDTAKAQLAAAEAQANVARNQGDYSVLLADADGVVMETVAEPGQVVAAGQTVVRLAHAGPREATVNLPETLRPDLGSDAQADLYDRAQTRSPARLRQLSDVADPLTRTFEARYVLGGAAVQAPLGATVTIRIPSARNGEDVSIPLGALMNDGTRTGVWILHEDNVSFRPVQVRQMGQEAAVLIGGVSAGDRVIALGAQFLHDGERVRSATVQEASR